MMDEMYPGHVLHNARIVKTITTILSLKLYSGKIILLEEVILWTKNM